MADRRKQVSENVPGEFFVDETCINCDTCRQIAPETFDDTGDYSFVFAQPDTEEKTRHALRALLACPTGSIGTLRKNSVKAVREDFPLHLDDGVYYSGFNSPKSFGGHSYFIRYAGEKRAEGNWPQGNWMVDSPKFLPHLVRRFEEMGGLCTIFLTHRDDVAEAEKYAAHFGCRRIIHRAELSAQPEAEMVLEGEEPQELAPGFLALPTPGHTRGHCVLLYKKRFLFSGDHLWWSRAMRRLSASRRVCWDSWADQTRSMAKLRDFRFEWVLPGHGQRVKLTPAQIRKELAALVNRMANPV